MFEQNDKALRTTWKIIISLVIIFAVGSLAAGIALAVVVDGVCFLVAPAGWFLCWLIWVGARLHMSYLCDIKLIRNKLYGENNDGLEMFLKGIKDLEKEEEKENLEEAKLALEELLMTDSITREEYIKQKKELLDKEKELYGMDKKE